MAGFELSARSIGLTSEDLDLRTWRAVIAKFVATALFVFFGAGLAAVLTGRMKAARTQVAPPWRQAY